MTQPFAHPKRLPLNVPGPFYTTGQDGVSDCLTCGAPECEAPSLLADVSGINNESYFTKQPLTAEDTEAACRALSVCCVRGFRYGGTDLAVIRRLGNDPSLCDFVEDEQGTLIRTVGADEELHRAFAASVKASERAASNRFVVSDRGHRVVWHFNWHPEDADLDAARREEWAALRARLAKNSVLVRWMNRLRNWLSRSLR